MRLCWRRGWRRLQCEAGSVLQETCDLKHCGKTRASGQIQGQAELVRESVPAFRTDPWLTGEDKSLPWDGRPEYHQKPSLPLSVTF